MAADLLLVNASNYWRTPVFPYAFVQVSALARARGLVVERLDLFGTPKARWGERLRRALDRAQPRLVGFTLRNLDSLVLREYQLPVPPSFGPTYVPVDDTRDAVRLVRSLTRAPIVVGGFGFTMHSDRLFDVLEVDYAVHGEPDALFERFDDVVAGRELERVSNLLWRSEGATKAAPRALFGPHPGPEYDATIVDELEAFYGAAALADQAVAVEVSRGCPYACYFCGEPAVKGRKVRYRELAAVAEDVDRLAARGLDRYFFVSSELNIGGPSFGLRLAELMTRARERAGRELEWSAYALPTLSNLEDLRTLVRSGYKCAWNEAQSLDDENLRATRVPYRSKHVVQYLKNVLTLDDERRDVRAATPGTFGTRVLGFFLGNTHATPDTLRRTLARVEAEGLASRFDASMLIPATRVFAFDGRPSVGDGEADVFVADLPDRTPDVALPRLVRPTYAFPPALVEAAGGRAAWLELVGWVADTFLSRAHVGLLVWVVFFGRHAPRAALRAWLDRAGDAARAALDHETSSPLERSLVEAALDGEPGLDRLLAPPAGQPFAMVPPPLNAALGALGRVLERVHRPELDVAARAVGLPEGYAALTPYAAGKILAARFDAEDAVLRRAQEGGATPLGTFLLARRLFAWNLRLRPDWNALVFGPPGEADAVDADAGDRGAGDTDAGDAVASLRA